MSKLVTIINDLVENTDITMSDIIEMMKSSVGGAQETGSLAASQTEAPQLMTSSQSQVTSSVCQEVDQKLPGILLPANWVPFNLSNVPSPHTNVSSGVSGILLSLSFLPFGVDRSISNE